MFTIREWKIIITLLFIFISSFIIYASFANSKSSNNTALDVQTQNQEVLKQKIAMIKDLNKSVMGESTRKVLNYLSSTTTDAQVKIISNSPFRDVKNDLTPDLIKTKFIAINGNAINGIGAQLFILFPAKPDHVYRLAFQLTNSTSTPLILADFAKAEDSPETIKAFLTNLQPYLNDPEMLK